MVDIVAISPDKSVAKVVISDHLNWDDVGAHLLLLQAKFNTYIAFVEEGQLASQFPDAAGLPAEIDVRFIERLHPTAEAFLEAAAAICAERGIGLVWRVTLQRDEAE